jgi:hypothetical protein
MQLLRAALLTGLVASSASAQLRGLPGGMPSGELGSWAGPVSETLAGWSDPSVQGLPELSALKPTSADDVRKLGLLVASIQDEDGGPRPTPQAFSRLPLERRRVILTEAISRARTTAAARAGELLEARRAGALSGPGAAFVQRRVDILLQEYAPYLTQEALESVEGAAPDIRAQADAESTRRSEALAEYGRKLRPSAPAADAAEAAAVAAPDSMPPFQNAESRVIYRRYDAPLAAAGLAKNGARFDAIAQEAFRRHSELIQPELDELSRQRIRPWTAERLTSRRSDLTAIADWLSDRASRFSMTDLPKAQRAQLDAHNAVSDAWNGAKALDERARARAAQAANRLDKDFGGYAVLADFYRAPMRDALNNVDHPRDAEMLKEDAQRMPPAGIPLPAAVLGRWEKAQPLAKAAWRRGKLLVLVGAALTILGPLASVKLSVLGLFVWAAGILLGRKVVRMKRAGDALRRHLS